MELERWRPGRGLVPRISLRDLEQIQRRFDDMLSQPLLPAVWRRIPSMEMCWVPAVNVFEKDDQFTVKAELPGMKEEDINISVVADTLTTEGERKAESEVKEDNYYYCERSYDSFSRSLAVLSNVDAKGIEASYEHGVMGISLPKIPAVKPKRISVSAKKKSEGQ